MTKFESTLKTARSAYKRALDKPYPQGFTIIPIWEQHQRENRKQIEQFSDAKAAISYAQDGMQSGFDGRRHEGEYELRRFAEIISTWKLKQLQEVYGPLPS